MAELKTKENKASVAGFLKTIKDEQKRKDAKELLSLFKEATGEKPTMWGASIIGFGKYSYESKRSSQKGEWFVTGFSPRKQQLSLYIMPHVKTYSEILKKLGKHTVSSGCCLYVKKLEDVDKAVLKKLVKTAYKDMQKHKGHIVVG